MHETHQMRIPRAAAGIVNVLVLGATGMLGSAAFRVLAKSAGAQVFGAVRRADAKRLFAPELASRLVVVDDLEDHQQLERLFDTVRPQVVINCTAVRKPVPPDPMKSISIFSLLPHRLGRLCRLRGARLIQISSDGVFSGSRGAYTEDDLPDANDLYGVAKLLGEVSEPHAVTLRTSIIGHELQTKAGLLEWFLSQGEQCRCYTRAIFSGFPTVVLAAGDSGCDHSSAGVARGLPRCDATDLEVRFAAVGCRSLWQENRDHRGRLGRHRSFPEFWTIRFGNGICCSRLARADRHHAS